MRMDLKWWHWILLLVVVLPGCAKAVAEDKTVALVNGAPITEAQLHAALVERVGVFGLRQMIDEKLLEQAARRHGVSVSEKEVDAAVQRQKRLYPSQREFEEQLRMLGWGMERDFRAHVKQALLIDRIVARQVKVSEADLHSYYKARQHEFVEPEKVRVRDILLTNRQNAQELLKAVRDPQSDFAALAKIFSEDPTTKDKGGDRGWERLNDLARPLAEAVRKLHPGDISDVVDNHGEWHILKLEKRIPARQKPLSEVKEEVRRLVEQQKREPLKRNFLQQLREQAKVQIDDPRLQAAFALKQ